MAFNRNSVYQTSTCNVNSASRINAYSRYYQNVYSDLPQNDISVAAPSYDSVWQGQNMDSNMAYNYTGAPTPTFYNLVAQGKYANTNGVLPIIKTVEGRPRSPVQIISRYRLDDDQAHFQNNTLSPPNQYNSRKRLRTKNDYSNSKGFIDTSSNSLNEISQIKNAEERRRIEDQVNEAMFYSRLYEVGYTASWYKLKKRDEDGREKASVVIEIIDPNKKIYKVYGGYTSLIKAKDLAFGKAFKKLNEIVDEQEKSTYANINNGTNDNMTSTFVPTPGTSILLPNPFYNPSVLNMTSPSASKSAGSSYNIYGPPGTEKSENEYDPVNYSYDSVQPEPPGCEQSYFKGFKESPRQTAEHLQGFQWQRNLLTETEKPLIDRPCAGRGDYESKFSKKANDLGYIYRCTKLPSKRFFQNIEYFGFRVEFGQRHEASTRLKITGSFLKDERQARESAYAMALEKLSKIMKNMELAARFGDYDSSTPTNSSQSYGSDPQISESVSLSAFGGDALRRKHQAANWNWESTSNDLSVLKSTPIFSMGRGKPKPSNLSAAGGEILDDREWRWPL